MSETASILEVAIKAGVSTATVSRVLNRSAAVSPETVEAVMKSVRALGYELPQRKPRSPAARPASSSRRRIAIVGLGRPNSAWLDLPVIARAVRAVTRAAREQGYGVMLEDIADPSQLSAALRDGEVAGAVIWLSSSLKPDVLYEISRHLPIVRAMGDQTEPVGFDHVAPNNRQVGALAREYLERQGCEEVVVLGDQPRWAMMRNRADGFFQASEQLGSEGRSVLISDERIDTFARRPAQSFSDWKGAADAILATSTRPIGLFSTRDNHTAVIGPLLTARGAKLGRDVIIVSCDNDPNMLAGLSPRPASIDLLTEEVGRRAFAQLLTRISAPSDPPVQILLTPRLNVSGDDATVRATLAADASTVAAR